MPPTTFDLCRSQEQKEEMASRKEAMEIDLTGKDIPTARQRKLERDREMKLLAQEHAPPQQMESHHNMAVPMDEGNDTGSPDVLGPETKDPDNTLRTPTGVYSANPQHTPLTPQPAQQIPVIDPNTAANVIKLSINTIEERLARIASNKNP